MDQPAQTLPAVVATQDREPIEALAIADQLATSLAATMAPRTIGQTVWLPLPDGYTLHDMTERRDRREPLDVRKRGTAQLLDLPSFITYCKDQDKAAEGYIYANTDARSFTAVFNDYRDTDLPGWRDHRAHFAAAFTPEFRRWQEHNGPSKAKNQTEFAEFIEDNMADLVAPYAQQLLDVATTIQAKTDINFSSAKRLHDGQVQLAYTEVIDAKAGADGALTIPREFELGLRLFKNGEGYRLKARLKYRLGNGGVRFWYELDRPERAIEDAFAGYIATVQEASGYSVLIGSPDKASN
jgi:uncharacterized protein YfdQ (DUF2303 family)